MTSSSIFSCTASWFNLLHYWSPQPTDSFCNIVHQPLYPLHPSPPSPAAIRIERWPDDASAAQQHVSPSLAVLLGRVSKGGAAAGWWLVPCFSPLAALDFLLMSLCPAYRAMQIQSGLFMQVFIQIWSCPSFSSTAEAVQTNEDGSYANLRERLDTKHLGASAVWLIFFFSESRSIISTSGCPFPAAMCHQQINWVHTDTLHSQSDTHVQRSISRSNQGAPLFSFKRWACFVCQLWLSYSISAIARFECKSPNTD